LRSGDISAHWPSPYPARLTSSAVVQVVARFNPPDAHARARQCREQHASVLSTLPAEAIRIDIGRAAGGDFVQVSVDDEYANRFTSTTN
jgi:hypothetical protein